MNVINSNFIIAQKYYALQLFHVIFYRSFMNVLWHSLRMGESDKVQIMKENYEERLSSYVNIYRENCT